MDLISVYSPTANSLQKVSPRNEDDDDGTKIFWVKLMQQKNTVKFSLFVFINRRGR
jgi:hypothetical protein